MSKRFIIWGIVVAALVGVIAWSGGGASGTARTLPLNLTSEDVTYTGTVIQSAGSATIAVIPITGAITGGTTPASGASTGSDDVVRMIDAVIDSEKFDGVLLEVDSPGGGVLASAEIADAVTRLTDAKIPVVSLMRDFAASGGYYVSAPTDYIVAHPTTLTGSIGVILTLPNLTKLADKVGYDEVVIKSGKLKDIGSSFRTMTPEERAIFQALIDEAYGDFVTVVADGRGMDKQTVRKLADGRIYTGRQAQELDLVDELGGRSESYSALAKLIGENGLDGNDLTIISFGRTYSLFEALRGQTSFTLDAGAISDIVSEVAGGDGLTMSVPPTQNRSNGQLRVEYRAELIS